MSKTFFQKLTSQLFNIVILVILIGVLVFLGRIALTKDDTNAHNDPNAQAHQRQSYTWGAGNSEQQKEADIDNFKNIINTIEQYKPSNLNSPLGITAEAHAFRGLIQDVNAIIKRHSSDTDFTNKVSQVNATLSRKQATYFPQLRESYSKVATRIMKEGNVVCNVIGNGNNIIEFVGERYSSIENQQIDFSLLQGHLELLRFKRIIFKYTQDEETISNSFNINSLDDTVLQ